MLRFKEYSQGQTVFLPVSFNRQILPGTFEYTLNYLVDEKLDLTIFHHKYNNDEPGRPAYDPNLLLKIVLLTFTDNDSAKMKTDQDSSIWDGLSRRTRKNRTISRISAFIENRRDHLRTLLTTRVFRK